MESCIDYIAAPGDSLEPRNALLRWGGNSADLEGRCASIQKGEHRQANSLLTKDIVLDWNPSQRKQKRLTRARLRLPCFWISKSVLVQISCHHHGSLDTVLPVHS